METIEVQPRDVHAIQSKVNGDGCALCFYCELPLGMTHHEHDHAPIPKNAGGEVTIPACVTCHSLKDRYGFKSWDAYLVMDAVSELANLGRMDDFTPGGQAPTSFPDEWSDMSRGARLTWSKMAQLAHRAPESIPHLDVSGFINPPHP